MEAREKSKGIGIKNQNANLRTRIGRSFVLARNGSLDCVMVHLLSSGSVKKCTYLAEKAQKFKCLVLVNFLKTYFLVKHVHLNEIFPETRKVGFGNWHFLH